MQVTATVLPRKEGSGHSLLIPSQFTTYLGLHTCLWFAAAICCTVYFALLLYLSHHVGFVGHIVDSQQEEAWDGSRRELGWRMN